MGYVNVEQDFSEYGGENAKSVIPIAKHVLDYPIWNAQNVQKTQ